MRRVAILLLVLAAGTGCRKKTAPEFYGLESTYSIMVARDGDEAYATETMDQVLAGLEQIPANTVEGPKAAELAATIKRERARIAQEEKDREAALAAAEAPPEGPGPGPSLFPPLDQPATPSGPVDAGGPQAPWGGMSSGDFSRLFGACFDAGPNKTLPGQPEGTTFVLKDDPKCRVQFKLVDPAASLYFVFVKDALIGQTTEKKTTTETVKPAPPPPSEPEDAGVFLLIPGAPVPEELRPKLAPPPAEP